MTTATMGRLAALALMFTLASGVVAGDAGADCKLDTSPLMRCALFSDYQIQDRALNQRYRQLIARTAPASVPALRKTQREWITFRERTCEAVQEAAQCNNLHCVGVAHDMCVLELAGRRSAELAHFMKDTALAAQRNFAYDRAVPE